MILKGWWVGALLLGASATAGAQVGYPPERSPYKDFEPRHELSLSLGIDESSRDPAGVAPHGGMVVTGRYQWRAGGPAYLFTQFSRIGAQRNVIDPSRSGAARSLGDRSWPTYAMDLGLGLGLTGGKSWHDLLPMVNLGAGLVSDFQSGADVGGYKFGTRFAFNWGAGVRWVPSGQRWGLRADITNRLYTYSYPASYFTAPTSGGTAVLNNTQPKSGWTNHAAFTLGIAYNFGRR